MRIAAVCLVATGCITSPGLYVEKTGAGAGRVVSDPAGINCGGDCGAIVDGPITLTANPLKSSVFVGWTGVEECGADPVCSFTTLDDLTLQARFEPFRPTLTVAPTANGTILAPGIDCGTDCSEEYAYGTSVSLTVKPVPGWALTGWTGIACPNANCSVAITEDTIATPILAQASNLEVTVVDYAGNGRVTSLPAGIECGAGATKCGTSFATGTVITLTASSYNVEWTGCMQIQTNKNTCVLEANGAAHVEATIR